MPKPEDARDSAKACALGTSADSLANAAAQDARPTRVHARASDAVRASLDALDRRLIDALQDGFPIEPHPWRVLAQAWGADEDDLIARVQRLLDAGLLSRFGPMFDAARMGGGLSLVAMAVPAERYEAVVAQVNAHPQVAHNYARDHRLNMWFVLATETPAQMRQVLDAIEQETGLPTFDMPKIEEFHVGLRIAV